MATARRAGRPASASLVDPEDDLPSSTYAGDFETTKIPHYDADKPATDQPAFGLIGDPEPLPYVQSGARPAHAALRGGAGSKSGPARRPTTRSGRPDRRGTQDLGLLLLRVGFGALLIVHGLQKAFGWWGGRGLGNFQDALADMGYQQRRHPHLRGGRHRDRAGVLLVLGLFTPLAAAAALAYLINALLAGTSRRRTRVLPVLSARRTRVRAHLIVVAAAIILIGPGRYGFDAGRGWARRPFVGSFAALLLGIGGGIAVWVLLNGGNPFGYAVRRRGWAPGPRWPRSAAAASRTSPPEAAARDRP